MDDMIVNFDLGKDDGSAYAIYSNGEYFKVCSDYDDECVDVKDKTVCWLHCPEKGICPFLTNQ